MNIILYQNSLDGRVAAYIYFATTLKKDKDTIFIAFKGNPQLDTLNIQPTDKLIILGANNPIVTKHKNAQQISHKFSNEETCTSILVYPKDRELPKYLEYIKIKELKLGKFEKSEIFCTQLQYLLDMYNSPNNSILNMLFNEKDDIFNYIMTIGEANFLNFKNTIKINAERAYVTNLYGEIKVGILNTRIYIADIADYILKKMECDVAIIWYIDKKDSMVFQLRSVGTVDVAEIARQYSGDGYRNAAGFTVPARVGFAVLENLVKKEEKPSKTTLDKVEGMELKAILDILGIPHSER